MHIQYLEVLILGRNLDPFLCNGAQVCSSPAVLCMDLFFSLFVSTFAGFIATLPRPITLRQKRWKMKRHWILTKSRNTVRAFRRSCAISPPFALFGETPLTWDALHGASDAASTFSCISKTFVEIRSGFGHGPRPAETMSGSPEQSRRGHAAEKDTRRESLQTCASTIPWKPGQASSVRAL